MRIGVDLIEVDRIRRAMERYGRLEQAWKRIETTFELFRPDGD